jgi:zinc/manganese transport system substrate-binding protein
MRRYASAAVALAIICTVFPARAQDKLKVVASFSILSDMVKNVGGERIAVDSLVGPNGNAHTYAPSPADAKKLADANVIFVNGLGFEGWLDRLVKASASKAPIVIASSGVKPRERAGDPDHGHDAGKTDPHAWQAVANAKIYVGNIRDGLIAADPAGKAVYEANAAAYLAQLDALEREVKNTVAKIHPERRRVITSHNAFGYFDAAYGISFTAPQGLSTEAEPSAKDVAAIISLIKSRHISAAFLENVTDPRLVNQIAKETGANVGGTLYSDALTDEKDEASTYIDLIRHNLKELAAALTS